MSCYYWFFNYVRSWTSQKIQNNELKFKTSIQAYNIKMTEHEHINKTKA